LDLLEIMFLMVKDIKRAMIINLMALLRMGEEK
jgi:hypothetical protein